MNKRTWLIAAAGVAAGAAARELYRRWREENIEGWVVLITGGSRGLGLAMARRFAQVGCRLAICARDEAELQRAAADLRARGADVLVVPCDVSDPAQVDRMTARVLAHYGRVDILVNNAGNIQVGPVEAMSVDDFRRAMDVMFWGVVHPTMALLPQMVARGSGRIVNITSIGGKIAVPHLRPLQRREVCRRRLFRGPSGRTCAARHQGGHHRPRPDAHGPHPQCRVRRRL